MICQHLDHAGSTCPDCKMDVDDYGNTEDLFLYCAMPDCGCPEFRLCMAGGNKSFVETLPVKLRKIAEQAERKRK